MADFGSPGTPSRHEKSLGLLTTKFVSLLQEAKDGVLDLKVVSKWKIRVFLAAKEEIFLFAWLSFVPPLHLAFTF